MAVDAQQVGETVSKALSKYKFEAALQTIPGTDIPQHEGKPDLLLHAVLGNAVQPLELSKEATHQLVYATSGAGKTARVMSLCAASPEHWYSVCDPMGNGGSSVLALIYQQFSSSENGGDNRRRLLEDFRLALYAFSFVHQACQENEMSAKMHLVAKAYGKYTGGDLGDDMISDVYRVLRSLRHNDEGILDVLGGMELPRCKIFCIDESQQFQRPPNFPIFSQDPNKPSAAKISPLLEAVSIFAPGCTVVVSGTELHLDLLRDACNSAVLKLSVKRAFEILEPTEFDMLDSEGICQFSTKLKIPGLSTAICEVRAHSPKVLRVLEGRPRFCAAFLEHCLCLWRDLEQAVDDPVDSSLIMEAAQKTIDGMVGVPQEVSASQPYTEVQLNCVAPYSPIRSLVRALVENTPNGRRREDLLRHAVAYHTFIGEEIIITDPELLGSWMRIECINQTYVGRLVEPLAIMCAITYFAWTKRPIRDWLSERIAEMDQPSMQGFAFEDMAAEALRALFATPFDDLDEDVKSRFTEFIPEGHDLQAWVDGGPSSVHGKHVKQNLSVNFLDWIAAGEGTNIPATLVGPDFSGFQNITTTVLVPLR